MPTIKKILSAGLLSALLIVSNLSSSVSAEDSTPATTPAPGTSNPQAPPAANPPQPEEPPATSPSTTDPANRTTDPANRTTDPAQPADPPATEPAAPAETPAPREHPLLNPPAAATVSTPAARPDQPSRTSTNLPQTATLNEGLVAYYPFNENANDESGNGHNGTVQGATLAKDRFGKANSAYSFDGVDDYIEVTDNASLRIASYTVSAWIKPDASLSGTWQRIVGKAGRNFNMWLHSSNFIHHRFHDAASTNSGPPDTPSNSTQRGQWNHVVITNNGTTAKTYLDGVEKASGPVSGSLVVHNTNLHIGKDLESRDYSFYKGFIDDLRIYNRAITAAEVQALYTASDPADNTDNNTQTEVEIRPGTLTITPPQTVNFGATTVSSSEQTLAVDLSAPNYFTVEDLKGSKAGYYTTLQVTDLSAGSKTIAATNLKLKVTNGTVHTLGGSEDKNVKVPAKTQEYLHFTSSSPATLLKRSADSKGLLGKYGVLPSFQLTIPAYQTLGNYTGTITYTLIEN